ncbi:hypothetical protein [Citrobacter meridianamericanus]|uniref:hypothetical protein n=1 Tax=Citrobacter meridianamericanus TaxID=2894201 RepID=UPI00351D0C11
MNRLYAVIPLCLTFSATAEPLLNGNILDSSGVIDELLSVSFSVSLTQAVKYYQGKEDTVLAPDAYAQTIKRASEKLSLNLNPSRYSRLNGVSYANLFLNARVVNINMFNADDLSSEYSKYPASVTWVSSLPDGTYYEGEYGEASSLNPLPLFSMKIVSDTFESKGVARIAESAGADVYSLRYKNGYIVADTAQGVVDFYSGLYADAAYKIIYQRHAEYENIMMNTYDSDGTPKYSGCTLTLDNTKTLTPKGRYSDYSVNGESVYLNSSYEFEAGYTGKSVCTVSGSSLTDERSFGFSPYRESRLSVLMPLYIFLLRCVMLSALPLRGTPRY